MTDDDRHVRKQEVTAKAMDTIKKAVEDAGENNGAPSNLHIFTQVPCLALSLVLRTTHRIIPVYDAPRGGSGGTRIGTACPSRPDQPRSRLTPPVQCVRRDLDVLGNRSTAVIHYAKETIQHGSSTDDAMTGLKLAFHSS